MPDVSAPASIVRGEVKRWLVVTGLAAVLGLGGWSARILFLDDPYVAGELKRIQESLQQVHELFDRERVALESAKHKNEKNEQIVAAARDTLEGDRRLHGAIKLVLLGTSARSDSVQGNRDDTFLVGTPPPVGSPLWVKARQVRRFLRRIDWDSAEIASIGTSIRSDLSPRIGPLLAFLGAEKQKWLAVASWSASTEEDQARWRKVVEAEHRYRAALHGAVVVMVASPISSGVQGLDLDLGLGSSSEISERLIEVNSAMQQLQWTASVRQVLALIGLVASILLLIQTIRYAMTGRLPRWWHSLRWILHKKARQRH
jgi:hypothetical protein